jgi:hypothetical protein
MADEQKKLPTPELDKVFAGVNLVVATGREAVMLLAKMASDGKMPLEHSTEAGKIVGKYIVAAMRADEQAAKARAENAANEDAQKMMGKMMLPPQGKVQ